MNAVIGAVIVRNSAIAWTSVSVARGNLPRLSRQAKAAPAHEVPGQEELRRPGRARSSKGAPRPSLLREGGVVTDLGPVTQAALRGRRAGQGVSRLDWEPRHA